MKGKVFKRSISLLLVTIMLCASNKTIYAAENSNGNVLMMENFSENLTKGSERGNFLVYAEVPTNGEIDMEPYLESYIGLSQKFIVNATSASTTGNLRLYLYNPKGNLVSDEWIMGVNQIVRWTVSLPSSGEWRLRVVAEGTDAPVEVFAGWQPE